MSQDRLKQQAAEAAIEYVKRDAVVGVGTGSTVDYFIDALRDIRNQITGAVSSSDASSERLRRSGIEVLELNSVDNIPVYVDGADEANRFLQLIKGGGGALTREKIVASVSERFVCIADESKLVDVLGGYPLPVEVIPMARSAVARALTRLGGRPELRQNTTTDNGNIILDVYGLKIQEPIRLEEQINNIPGVVTNGLFALRPADLLLIATASGVERLKADWPA